MFDMFYDFHVAPAMRASEIAFNQAEEMHRVACQQAEEMHRIACQQAFEMQNNQQAEDNYNFEADFAATEARIARLRAEISKIK